MMTPEEEFTLEQIRITAEQAKAKVELGEKVERLIANPDFDRIIHVQYFEKEASRLAMLKADPSMQAPESQKAIDDALMGIGQFRQFIMGIKREAQAAERSLEEAREMEEEMTGAANDAVTEE